MLFQGFLIFVGCRCYIQMVFFKGIFSIPFYYSCSSCDDWYDLYFPISHFLAPNMKIYTFALLLSGLLLDVVVTWDYHMYDHIHAWFFLLYDYVQLFTRDMSICCDLKVHRMVTLSFPITLSGCADNCVVHPLCYCSACVCLGVTGQLLHYAS